jgi:hypothetical protein
VLSWWRLGCSNAAKNHPMDSRRRCCHRCHKFIKQQLEAQARARGYWRVHRRKASCHLIGRTSSYFIIKQQSEAQTKARRCWRVHRRKAPCSLVERTSYNSIIIMRQTHLTFPKEYRTLPPRGYFLADSMWIPVP